MDTIKILGHTFTRMTDDDYMGFAGAGPNSYICHASDVTLIYDHDTSIVSEIGEDGSQVDWSAEQVNG